MKVTMRHYPPHWAFICGLCLVYYLGLALTQRIDGDEGYFLYAARLVQHGEYPYIDFFYPQFPLIAYLWGWLLKPVGLTWISARVLAAGVATLSAWAFWRLARRGTQHDGLALGLLFVYLISDIGMEVAVVVKSFAPASLCLLLAWLAGSGNLGQPDRGLRSDAWAWGSCGFLCGLALLTRLTVLPVILLMPLALLLGQRTHGRKLAGLILCWLSGFLPALIVLGMFWRHAPLAFVYDNWLYHSLGASSSLKARFSENTKVAFDVVFLNPIWLAALGLLACDCFRRRATAADWFYRSAFLVMSVVSFIPIRSFHLYYCFATPWLLLASAPALNAFWHGAVRMLWTRYRPVAWLGGAVMVMLFAVTPYRAMERRWPTWTWRPQTPEAREEYDLRLGVVRAIARQINEMAPAGTRLLTWWPGYALEVNVPLLEGMENHFALRVGTFEKNKALAKRGGVLHTITNEDVSLAIRRKEAALIVVGIWAEMASGIPRPTTEREIQAAGYRYQGQIGSSSFYLRQ